MAFHVLRNWTQQRQWTINIAAILTTVLLLAYTNNMYMKLGRHPHTPFGAYSVFSSLSPRQMDMGEVVRGLWAPYLHGLGERTFIMDDGKEYTIDEDSTMWEENLGRKVVILDVDTRIDTLQNDEGTILNSQSLTSERITGKTAGFLNHLLFALIHGYDYRLVRAPEYEGRHGTWSKVNVLGEALDTYDIAVFADADAVFQYPRLPLEWMLSYWNVTSRTLLTLSKDPDSTKNRDANGLVMLNTGFMVAQRSERAQEMIAAWEDCPRGSRWPSCRRWATDWAHEQAAFANHVRYEYNATSDEIRDLGYFEVNGPKGRFVKHDWFNKKAPVADLYQMLSEDFVQRLHAWFLEKKDVFYVDASELKYPMDGDLEI